MIEKKKDLLLKVLGKLKPYRDIADGLSVFVQSEYASEETIDNIIHFLKEKIQQVKHMQQEQAQQKVKRIKKIAEKEEKKDIDDAEKLLSQLS